MRTLMQKTRWSAVALTILLTLSCQKSFEYANNFDTSNDPVDYQAIGEAHNRGLDILFETLVALKEDIGPLSKETYVEYIEAIEGSALAFAKKEGMESEIIEQMAGGFAEIRQDVNPLSSGRTAYTERYSERLINATSLTPSSQSYARKIDNVATYGVDYNAIINGLNALERQIRATGTSRENPILLAQIAVAKSSAYYWRENWQAWESQLGLLDSRGVAANGFRFTGGSIIAADAGAAIFWGGGAAWMGMIPVWGWVGWGASTALFSAAASGCFAVGYLLTNQYNVPTNVDRAIERRQ